MVRRLGAAPRCARWPGPTTAGWTWWWSLLSDRLPGRASPRPCVPAPTWTVTTSTTYEAPACRSAASRCGTTSTASSTPRCPIAATGSCQGPGRCSSRRAEAGVVSLPAVLTGPLLRRAEPGRVLVWLATSRPVTVQGEILSLASGGGGEGPRRLGRGGGGGGRGGTPRVWRP